MFGVLLLDGCYGMLPALNVETAIREEERLHLRVLGRADQTFELILLGQKDRGIHLEERLKLQLEKGYWKAML